MIEDVNLRLSRDVTAGLAVTSFGAFRCRVDGEPVIQWGAGRSRALMQYLIAQRDRGASRDELTAALWPSSEPGKAINSLKVAVHALRRVLRPSPHIGVEFTGDGYALRGRLWSDLDELAELSRRARSAERGDDPLMAASYSASAEALHVGPFLPGVEADWAQECRTWARLETVRVHDVALRVALRAGDADGVYVAARALLDIERCHEPAYQATMWLHARRGERSAVDAVFRRCRRRLRADLDLQPDTLTTDLYERAMRGERDDRVLIPLLDSTGRHDREAIRCPRSG